MESSFLTRIKENEHLLSNSESYLVDYIKDHLDHISQLSIVQLSLEASVSTATIVRAMQKLGYGGFTSFKIRLKDENAENSKFSNVEIADHKIKEAIFKNEREVTQTIKMLDSGTIEDAVQKIFYADKLMLFARGLSELIAKEMTIKFQLLGKYSEMHNDPNIIRTISNRIGAQSLVIFISLNGNTEELVQAAKNCKANGVSTMTLTTNRQSPLSDLSEINFVGYKSKISYFPDYEVRSRLPIQVIARILLDAYAIRTQEKDTM
ncbi:MurR/RpiR family transcriptional regulator [Sporolactobacillus putidus]|uniref:RpiR family transcriptional regulator n=1 Tax=Sporolactobacillus putidus TaxID=492735 RepID=A0A917S570_9BACL|nr:MurR/RpiR family transcriptional regulator [Sporolactobacillus putidus]GGL56550.1 RpiR family transcriptional regulator [Sporolactobacillus putidus]